jgi:SAM-dependent methyltransferase
MKETQLSSQTNAQAFDVESEVIRRYKAGAQAPEPALCCPVQYQGEYLKMLPTEIIEKDYGCGDPSVYVFEGDRALDLGSGSGKICYILSQKVGATGHVIGVDFNPAMLALSRKYLKPMQEKLGYGNVDFRTGKIQDLALDLDLLQQWLDTHPVKTTEDMAALDAECDRIRREQPLVPDNSVDVVVSNCVLNLVSARDKVHLFGEIHRVLARDGRAVISDIVCDEEPTQAILDDPELWSGCISGAYQEKAFLEQFAEAGFYGIEILKREEEPWQVVDGIEFRSLTVQAFKGKEGPCLERNQAVIYKGPWKQVDDDDGHTFQRGERSAVCDKTFNLLTSPAGPYAEHMLAVPPMQKIPLNQAEEFACLGARKRHPRETKGDDYTLNMQAEDACCSETSSTTVSACCGETPGRNTCRSLLKLL